MNGLGRIEHGMVVGGQGFPYGQVRPKKLRNPQDVRGVVHVVKRVGKLS